MVISIVIVNKTPLTKFIMSKIIYDSNHHFNIVEVNLETDEDKILFEDQASFDNYTNSY